MLCETVPLFISFSGLLRLLCEGKIQRDCLRKGLYFLNCSPRYLNLRTNQDVLDAERDYGVKAREM